MLPQLLKALDDSDAELRKGAIGALGHMGEEAKDGAPELMKALYDSDLEVRQFAADALAKMGTEAVRKLAKYTDHYDTWVRERGLRAWRSSAKKAKEAVPELVHALDDWHFEIRASAAQLLGSMGNLVAKTVTFAFRGSYNFTIVKTLVLFWSQDIQPL